MAQADTTYNKMMWGPSASPRFCTACGEFVCKDNYIEFGIVATPSSPTPSRKWGFHKDCVPKLTQNFEFNKERIKQGAMR